ncbi:hypothetical protein Tco_0355222 [Tanacetum coccineum]
MDACHVLLGGPWQFDRNTKHDGFKNTYIFEKDDTTIVLVPSDHRKKTKNRFLSRVEFLAEVNETTNVFAIVVDAVVIRDFYKKFYNSLGRVPNCCSSSIGKTRGLLSFPKRIGWEGLITV